jgi:hypothetical protein
MRANLNRALAFCGLAVEESGNLVSTEKVQTLTDAQRRTRSHEERCRQASHQNRTDRRRRAPSWIALLAVNCRSFLSTRSPRKPRTRNRRAFQPRERTVRNVSESDGSCTKIKWAVQKEDAEEVLTLLSLAHKRIDGAYMPPPNQHVARRARPYDFVGPTPPYTHTPVRCPSRRSI